VPVPPIVEQVFERNSIELPSGEVPSFGNFGSTLGEKVFSELQASLLGALPHDVAVLVTVTDIGRSTPEVDATDSFHVDALRLIGDGLTVRRSSHWINCGRKKRTPAHAPRLGRGI
jgi:hypothetical protein